MLISIIKVKNIHESNNKWNLPKDYAINDKSKVTKIHKIRESKIAKGSIKFSGLNY